MRINVTPDKEKVRSILKLIENRERFVSQIDEEEFTTNAVENYYEIIKELGTALLLLDGVKIIGENAHKDLLDGLSKYGEFSEADVFLLQDLRVKRNQSSYEGKSIDKAYLDSNKKKLLDIIKKLKVVVGGRVR